MRKLLAMFLAIMCLISGSVVFAETVDFSNMTTEELSALVASLAAELEARETAAETEPTEPTVSQENVSGEAALAAIDMEAANAKYTHLEKGAKGNAVTQLQTRLKELGFYSITIDGDYGNGTVNAIKAFEEYNGLEQTGIATVQLQAYIYSDNAMGIEIPDIEITSVGLKKSYDYYFLRPTLVNHTDYTINAITYMIKVYNAAGERISSSGPMTANDVYVYPNATDYYREYATGEVGKMNIKPGGKYSISYNNEIDLYSFDNTQTNAVYIAITRYVTSDGTIVEIPENDQVWYGSDGKIVTVQYENNLKPVEELTFELEERADSFSLGVDCYYISNFHAEVVGLPLGGVYLSYVSDDSFAKEAGLKEGDIVVKIGDVWVYDDYSINLAKALMDEQEPTPVIFYRRGQKAETEITIY